MSRLITGLTYGYTTLILVVSLAKFVTAIIPSDIEHLDKIAHFATYAGLSIVWVLFYYKVKKIEIKKSAFLSLLFSVFFGVLMEFFQKMFTSFRQFEYYDMLANTLGSLSGLLIFGIFFMFIKKRQR